MDAHGIDYMFGLTKQEIKIIERTTGLKRCDFVVIDKVKDDFLKKISDRHPVFLKIMNNGIRHRLKIFNDKCVFLDLNGCKLPLNSRPVYCRLYPFWFTHDLRLMFIASGKCLAISNALSHENVLAIMGDKKSDLVKLFKRLLKYADIK